MVAEAKLGTAVVPIRAVLDKLDDDLRDAKAKVEKAASDAAGEVKRKFAGIDFGSDALKKYGEQAMKVGGMLTLGVTTPLAMMGKGAISAASDLSESMSKSEVVFGDMADSMAAFYDTAAASMGMSKQAAAEAAGTFGNLFQAMGLGQEDAAGMSKNLLQLGADLASFNNMNPTEVLDKLRAGLVGEAEPLRALGVNLSAARMEMEAARLGIVKTTVDQGALTEAHDKYNLAVQKLIEARRKYGAGSTQAAAASMAVAKAEEAIQEAMAGSTEELTTAQKAQAAYAIIMQDTKLAQGDFARTSDGLANSQRILAAQFADLQAELGTQLLPIAVKVAEVLKGVMSTFAGMSPEVQTAVVVFAGFLAVVGPLTTGLGALVSLAGILTAQQTAATVATVAHTAAMGVQKAAMVAVTAAQWLLNAALAANPIGIVVLALAALAAALIYAYNNSEDFRRIVDGVWSWLQRATESVFRAVGGVLDGFAQGLQGTVHDVGEAVASIIAFFTGLPGSLAATIAGVLDAAGRIGSAIRDGIIGGIKGTLGAIGNLTQQLLDSLRYVINSAIDAVNQAIPDELGFYVGDRWIGIDLPDNPIPHLARGVESFGGGMALLGEEGPELAMLPRGTRVLPAGETRQALGGNTYNYTQIVNTNAPAEPVIRDFQQMRSWALAGG